jgi:hypothetical protein
MDKSYYIKLRDNFTPSKIKLIFIAESPPASGKYFYSPDGGTDEPLFAAMMKCVLKIKPETKEPGLEAFKQNGFLLVDATYEPINKGLSEIQRDTKILEAYDSLVKDLISIDSTKKAPLILIKANICKLLEPKLADDGFYVKNNGVIIPFPVVWHLNTFCKLVQNLLK